MATDNKSYVETVKELRALRMAQLKQMTQEQRANSMMLDYNRRMIRQNEMLQNSIRDLGTRVVNSITSLSGKLISGTMKTATGVAGAAASVTGSITSGIASMLPMAIAGMAAKMLIWDNMSKETKQRLTDAFGNLFRKMVAPLEGILKGVFDKFKNITVESPLFDAITDKLSSLVKLIVATAHYMEPFFEKITDVMKMDPTKLLTDALKLAGSAVLLRHMIPMTTSILMTMLGNRLLVGRLADAMGRANMPLAGPGGNRYIPMGGASGMGGAGAAGAAAAATAPAGVRSGYAALQRNKILLTEIQAKQMASKAATARALAMTYARVGIRAAVAWVPFIGWMTTLGFLGYEAYSVIKQYLPADQLKGIEERDLRDAASIYFGDDTEERREKLNMMSQVSGEALDYTGVPYAEALTPKREEALREMTTGKLAPENFVWAEDPSHSPLTLEERKTHEEVRLILKEQKAAYQAMMVQKAEEDKDGKIAGFILKKIQKLWRSMTKEEKRTAIDSVSVLDHTANYVYIVTDMSGTIAKLTYDEYFKMKDMINNSMEELTAREALEKVTGGRVATPKKVSDGSATEVPQTSTTPATGEMTGWEGIKAIIRKYESGDSYDKPFGGKIVNGKMTSPYANLPKNLTEMTGEEVLAFQLQQIAGTKGKINKFNKKGEPLGTGAVGAYQFNNEDVLSVFYGENPDLLKKPFDKAMQDRIADWWKTKAMSKYGNNMEKFVVGQWEAFQVNKKAKEELVAALSGSPIAQAATSGIGDGAGLKGAQAQKFWGQQMEDAIRELKSPFGNKTLLKVNGLDVFDEAGKKAEEAKEILTGKALDVYNFLTSFDERGNAMKNIVNALTQKAVEETSNKPSVTTVVDNSSHDTIVTTSGGGGGMGSAPWYSPVGMSAGYATQFNSLAGIGRQ